MMVGLITVADGMLGGATRSGRLSAGMLTFMDLFLLNDPIVSSEGKKEKWGSNWQESAVGSGGCQSYPPKIITCSCQILLTVTEEHQRDKLCLFFKEYVLAGHRSLSCPKVLMLSSAFPQQAVQVNYLLYNSLELLWVYHRGDTLPSPLFTFATIVTADTAISAQVQASMLNFPPPPPHCHNNTWEREREEQRNWCWTGDGVGYMLNWSNWFARSLPAVTLKPGNLFPHCLCHKSFPQWFCSFWSAVGFWLAAETWDPANVCQWS